MQDIAHIFVNFWCFFDAAEEQNYKPNLDMFGNCLEGVLNSRLELYRLIWLIDWEMFESGFGMQAELGRKPAGHTNSLAGGQICLSLMRSTPRTNKFGVASLKDLMGTNNNNTSIYKMEVLLLVAYSL